MIRNKESGLIQDAFDPHAQRYRRVGAAVTGADEPDGDDALVTYVYQLHITTIGLEAQTVQPSSMRYEVVIGAALPSIAAAEQYLVSESSIARSTACGSTPSPLTTYSR